MAVIDWPGTYLHTWLNGDDNDEIIHMVLEGKMCELMVMTNPALYRPYVTVNAKGVKQQLFVQMSKALYGLLQSALKWYWKLRTALEEEGFVINPYDPCVANKVVNGK